jgi:hypothetical protein
VNAPRLEADRRRDTRRQDAAALLAYRPGGLARRTDSEPAGVHSLDLPPLWRACLVVETAGKLWLVPNSPDGWKRRLPLTMTTDARRDRLTPARGADLALLGIPEKAS